MLKRSFNGFHGTFSCLHSFRYLMLYSTSLDSKNGITNPVLFKFLVNSVGFSAEEAISIVTKVRDPSKSTKKFQLVLDFLRSSGFSDTHIRGLLKVVPNVLHSKVEKTLEPKIRVFQELGFSGSDLGLIISRHPYVLQRSIKDHIVPALEILKSVFGSNEQLRAMLKMDAHFLLSNNVRSYLPANLLLLQSYGVPREKIKWLLLHRPRLLLPRTRYFGNLVKQVEEKLRIPPTSATFVYGLSVLSMTSKEKFESLIRVFRSYGWSETEISNLLRIQPNIMGLSEETLRGKLKYFMEDLGCVSGFLSKYPVLLGYSMEKRILPRTTVMQTLKEKQLLKKDVSISGYAKMVESTFVDKYVLPFKNNLPELYQYYTKTTARSL